MRISQTGDSVGDLHGITLKLDYLQSQLHVDALRLNSICEANNYLDNYLDIVNASNIDPHLGDTSQLNFLLTSLENRNMSLVLDLHVNHIPGVVGNSKLAHREHLLVENVLRFWLLHGVHGFYLKVNQLFNIFFSAPLICLTRILFRDSILLPTKRICGKTLLSGKLWWTLSAASFLNEES